MPLVVRAATRDRGFLPVLAMLGVARMWDWVARNRQTLFVIGVSTLVFVGLMAATRNLIAPALSLAVAGFASGAIAYAVGQRLAGRPVTAKESLVQGGLAALITVATLGAGRVLAPVFTSLAPATRAIPPTVATVTVDTTAGAAFGAGAKVVENVADHRPLGDGVPDSIALGAVNGALLHPTAKVVGAISVASPKPARVDAAPPPARAPPTIGIAGALGGETARVSPRASRRAGAPKAVPDDFVPAPPLAHAETRSLRPAAEEPGGGLPFPTPRRRDYDPAAYWKSRELVDVVGSADETDAQRVAWELTRLPEAIREKLREQGTRVRVCRNSVTEYMTDLRGVQPRGWPEGSTWDSVTGMGAVRSRNEIVIATVPAENGRGLHHQGSANVVWHEVGHAVDMVGAVDVSSTDAELIAARAADLSLLPEYQRQAGQAGLQETFAESLALFLNGDRRWPHLYRYWETHPLTR